MSSINIIFNELFEGKNGRKINALTYILLSISINLKHKKDTFVSFLYYALSNIADMLADELLEIFFKWREVTEGGIELIEGVAFILRGEGFCVGRVEG